MRNSHGMPAVSSFLDTDLYKLTMQCAIHKYIPGIQVTYAFTNRTPHMRLDTKAYEWIQQEVSNLGNIRLSSEEYQYLQTKCPYLSESYLQYLSTFRLHPEKQVKITFTPVDDTYGDIHYEIEGLWLETILYEIPLLAITSEAYFKFCDRNWTHEGQEQRAYDKGVKLINGGCNFSEFGSRRRRDYHTHDLVVQGLVRASNHAGKGSLTGTSNVHFAMKYGISPVGTVAHEWFMGVASITEDYEHANETALRYWVGCFGEGVLGIALTDTFGTPVFLKSFRKALPTKDEVEKAKSTLPNALRPALSAEEVVNLSPVVPPSQLLPAKARSYAETFTGVRQDSGDPLKFVDIMREFYDQEGITEKKTIVFSDSLNVERCLEYKKVAEERNFLPSFGIGTHFTNDFGKASPPMNIVIKLSSASGHPAVKISDNIGKNTGDLDTVHKVKEVLGYGENGESGWVVDESRRW